MIYDPLSFDRSKPEACEAALAALAATLFARPELFDPELMTRLTDLLASRELSDTALTGIAKLFEFLASTPAASRAWKCLCEVLQDTSLETRIRQHLLQVVAEFVQWSPEVVRLEGILHLAEAPALAGDRAFLLDHGVELFVFSAPEDFTIEHLKRIANTFCDAPRLRYVLYWLAGRLALAPEVRKFLTDELTSRFPVQASAKSLLQKHPIRLLAVMNIAMGQGDDVVRVAPLLQALLDANSQLSLTLVAPRLHLYDNPRITTIPITHTAGIEAALADPFDGVIEFFQPEWPGFTYHPAAHFALEKYLEQHPPKLVIKGDIGRVCSGHSGSRLPFLYQKVEVNGQDIAAELSLDQCVVRNMYEPNMRLVAELGLPMRSAEEAPLTPSVLTGTRSADAVRIWKDLTGRDSRSSRRPVALMNPFGGTGTTKGFYEQDAIVAAEISGLVAEGYFVIVVPNGQAWARRETVQRILARVDAATRAEVRIAPDLSETDEAEKMQFAERPELNYADRVMRLVKYFVSYADLVVAVEGWLAHLAYNLGRPLRLFLAAGSFPAEYHPRYRGHTQRRVTALSPLARAAHLKSGLLAEASPCALAHSPRKILLELALGGLGRFGRDDVLGLLSQAMTSLDPQVRTWAAAALRRFESPAAVKKDLIAALKDRWPTVLKEAAEALLESGIDCSYELGAGYKQILQAHKDIAAQNWEAVARMGPAALPALFQASQSEVYDISYGAKRLSAEMVGPFVPVLRKSQAAPIGSSSSI